MAFHLRCLLVFNFMTEEHQKSSQQSQPDNSRSAGANLLDQKLQAITNPDFWHAYREVLKFSVIGSLPPVLFFILLHTMNTAYGYMLNNNDKNGAILACVNTVLMSSFFLYQMPKESENAMIEAIANFEKCRQIWRGSDEQKNQ